MRRLAPLALAPALLLGLAALAPGCGGGGSGGGGASTAAPVASAAPAPTASASPAPAASATPAPATSAAPTPRPPLGRGLAWVRSNPMVITGLTVAMPPPTATHVRAYLDDFGANAVHLWETGLPTELDGWRLGGPPGMRWLSWVQPDGTSRDGGQVLGGVAPGAPGRIGYQIGDEPVDLAALARCEAGAAVVRAADPDALIVCNVLVGTPDIAAQLDRIGRSPDFDVFSYDDYRRTQSVYANLAKVRAAALRAGKPYWRYLCGFEFRGMPAESDLRWDAFVGLVYGYTGHHWFLYQIEPTNPDLTPAFFDRKGDFEAPRPARFAQAAQVNRELAHLGRAITQLTSVDVRYAPALALLQPPGTQPWVRGAGGDPFITRLVGEGLHDLLVGFFVDDQGERYVMVQNVNHAGGTWAADSTAPQTISVDLDFSSVTDPAFARDRVQVLDKLTGQVVDVPLQVAAPGRSGTLRVRLAAGDPILFKYATGRPFALQ